MGTRKSWGGEFCFVGFESDGGVLELNREGNCFCFRGCEPKGEVCVKLGQKAQVCSIDFGLI